jgi:hypothetical protein
MYLKGLLVDEDGRKSSMYKKITTTTKITVIKRNTLANQVSSLIIV